MSETRQTVFRQTKEEFEQLKNDAHEHKMNISDYLRYLVLKERNGTQKNISKKPIQKTENEFICPCCKTLIGYRFLEMNGEKHRIMENFCDCGQEIDWSDIDKIKFGVTNELLRYLVAKERKEREK